MKIIAYTYDADVHCVHCTQMQFGDTRKEWSTDEHNIPHEAQDSEGNSIHPVFSTDEHDFTHCGTCGDELE